MSSTALCNVWQLAARQADLTVRLPGEVPLFFRRIPPGSFLMGSRGGGEADEEPVHRVMLAREFYLGTFVVTQEQYQAVARECPALASRAEPSHFQGARRPVEGVDWQEATAFCNWLSQSGRLTPGTTACLPTEAQWEYACRAGSETDYYQGDGEAALAEVGWYVGNSGLGTHPVDERMEIHPFGLFGMHGNVWEWCLDGWDDDAYKKRVEGVVEPCSRVEGNPHRVLRGGPWNGSARFCRSSIRHRRRADDRRRRLGFRVCLVPSPVRTEETGGAEVDLARERLLRAAGEFL